MAPAQSPGTRTPRSQAPEAHPSERRVGVVVVHYGDPEPTLRCLRSIAVAGEGVEARTVVVDNSANLSREAVRALGAEHLSCPDNPGFGVGANRGVEHLGRTRTAGRHSAGRPPAAWVILNGDVALLPGYLAGAVEALAASPSAGAAGGPLFLESEGGPLWYAGGEARPILGLVRQSRDPADAERRREVSFLTGAAFAVRPEAWEAVGGFDPAFFLYNEDLDFSLRLARAGYRLLFEPRMRAVHDLGGATGSAAESPLYLEHLTATRLLPYPGRLHRLWLAALHTGWVLVRAGRIALSVGQSPRPRGRGERIRALLRGHARALGTAWRGRPGIE